MGPHHLAKAQAHLARENSIHQAKLDRYVGLLAAGRKPMSRPPVPIETSSRLLRTRREEQAVEAAAAPPHDGSAAAKLPSVVANTIDIQSRIMPTRKNSCRATTPSWPLTSDHLIAAVASQPADHRPGDRWCR